MVNSNPFSTPVRTTSGLVSCTSRPVRDTAHRQRSIWVPWHWQGPGAPGAQVPHPSLISKIPRKKSTNPFFFGKKHMYVCVYI